MAQDNMYKIIDKQLSDRHWGTLAKGKSPGKHPRFYVMDYRGLALATGIIRYFYHVDEPGTRIFYRGQRQDWEVIPSVYRGCKNSTQVQRRNLLLNEQLEIIKPDFDPQGTDDEREALAQHYGLHTRFLDAVDNVHSALWFAYDDINKQGPLLDDSVGYVQVLAIPTDGAKFLDLRTKPSLWLRPHIQQAFAIKLDNHMSALGSFARFLVATFIISRENLHLWSNYDFLTHEYFYPSIAVDRGLQFWEKAEGKLKEEGFI